MPEFNFIKTLNLIIRFGGDKKIEVASGRQSEGVIVLSSPLETKAVDLSKNLINRRPKVKSTAVISKELRSHSIPRSEMS